MSLARLWPAPRPLSLGGRVLEVLPLRLRDLAWLECWAATAIGDDPARALAEAALIEDESARRAALRGLYDQYESQADPWAGGPLGALLGTRAGIAEQIRLTVRRGRRGRVRHLRRSVALDIAQHVTPDEWSCWRAVAWCVDPLDAAAEAIDREIGVVWPEPRAHATPPDERGGWGKSLFTAVVGVATTGGTAAGTGWDLDTLGDLTLGQWNWLRTAGNIRPEVAEPKEPPTGVGWLAFDAAVMKPRREFWAAADKPSEPAPGANGLPSRSAPDPAPPAP